MIKTEKILQKVNTVLKNQAKQEGCSNWDHNKIFDFKNKSVNCTCERRKEVKSEKNASNLYN